MIPPIARQFIAGETPESALNHASEIDTGISVILNLLGEHYESPEPAKKDTEAYLDLINQIPETDSEVCLSVKPSQLGLDVSEDLFEKNFRQIVAQADEANVFVWCDMEDSETTDATLDVFVDLATAYPWTVGQCLQSNLKRTRDDLERVIDVPGKIRIVKGAYDEPASIAYTEKDRIDTAYKEDINYLFEHREQGVAVGSHDPQMISLARRLGKEHETEYEIQMLMGVRTDAQRELAAEGIDVWQYAPYGNEWFSYFYRRIRERKENALFAARAILGR